MKRRLRIAMVVSLKGGMSPFTRRDVDSMLAAGHDVDILPAKAEPGRPVPAGAHVVLPRYGARALWAVLGLARVLSEQRGRRVLRDALRDSEMVSALNACAFYARVTALPDLVYAVFGDRKLFTAYYLSLLWDRPLTVTIHAYELYDNPNPRVFRKALDRCRRIMTVTEYNRHLLQTEWGIEPSRVDVVRITVDEELFRAAQPFVVLCVGSVSFKKGHATLFEAVRLLDDLDVEVWVVGGAGGAHPADPLALAEQHGVAKQCVVLGWQSEQAVAALMRRADVLCAPSRTDPDGRKEGFPTVLAEAMHSGLPVISTRHAEIPAVVAAALVAEDSPRELADAIARYKTDPALRKADADRNREIADQLFLEAPRRDLLRVLGEVVDAGIR
jgi:colanic acid/amylovoran biosynthesis glycosyltransferase